MPTDQRDYLIDQYRQKHKAEGNYGHGPKESEARDIKNLIYEHAEPSFPAHSLRVLDYGAGTSHLLEFVFPDPQDEKVRYDPAIPSLAGEPDGEFDFALCTDVLEHIPEPDVPAFLFDIATLAHGAFFTVCTTRAVHRLPDGQNAHCTVRDAEWWKNQISQEFIITHAQPARRENAHFYLGQSRQF